MNKFRILSDGYFFKIQRKRFIGWSTIKVQRGAFDDNGSCFGSYEQAINGIVRRYSIKEFIRGYFLFKKKNYAIRDI